MNASSRSCLLVTLLWILTLSGCGPNREPNNTGQSDNSGAAGQGDASPKPLTPVKLMLNWYPEAEHGGYYSALVNGYYKEAGLDVTIIKGGPNAPVVPQTARGAVQFGVTNADRVILARAEGAKIKALMAPLQNSPRCLLVHAESNIKSFDDIKDVTLMMRRENPWAQFLMAKLKLENVNIAPNSAGLAPFLNDKKSLKQGYVISEPFVAKEKGGDVRTLLVADLGFNPYTSVLTASDDYLQAHPKIVQAMVQASIRGWQTYLKEPDSANQEIHKLNPEMGPEILAYGVSAIKSHCLGDSGLDQIGQMSEQRWSELTAQLESLKLLEAGASPANEAFTKRFLAAPANE